MIKLFAIDIDGTLLNSQGKLSEKTKDAIKRLNEAGIRSVLASGRVFKSIKYYQDLLATNNPMVATNGSMVGLNSKEVYKTYFIDNQILIGLYNFCLENKLNFHFYDKDTYYSNTLNLEKIKHLRNENEYGMNYQVDLVLKEDPVKYFLSLGKSTNKFQITGIDKYNLSRDEFIDILNKKFDNKLYITGSGESVLEIMDKDASKWNGVCDICNIMGINNDEVAAIGDSYNDIPMVKFAKYGFAMSNANDQLKKHADIIVSSNNDDGVVEAIDYIIELNKNV